MSGSGHEHVGSALDLGGVLDVAGRQRVEETLRGRARQQQTIAELGELALREPEIQCVLDRAVEMIARTLEAQFCKVLELLPGREELLLRAGVGWSEGLVGHAIVGSARDSQAGYTLESDGPVVVEDLGRETRFSGPPLLTDHGVVSGMSCVIRCAGGTPWGVLGTHTVERTAFTQHDLNFLVAAANVLGAAIDRRRSDEALRESEHRFRQIAENVNVVFYVTDIPERRVRYVSSAYTRLWGLDREALYGDQSVWNDLIHAEDRAVVLDAYARFLDDGPPYDIEYRVILPDGDERWVHDRASVAARDEQGAITRITGLAEDVTDRKRNEDRMRTVLAELNHRVKNTLAVIQSIARQTIRQAPDLEAFSRSFEQRLQSIASAHSLLTRTEWSGASLAEIVESEVRARAGGFGDRSSVAGPPVTLRPKAALAMHMVVHELITNACKYGALKSGAGRLEIDWRVSPGAAPRLYLTWIERTPHEVREPQQTGYGSRLIEQLVEYDLGGEIVRDFHPEGLRCTIEFPLLGATHRRAVLSPVSMGGTSRSRAQRVLLVEDNATLAMALRDELERSGVPTAGPASTLDEAMNLVDVQPPCAAILDVDLDGTKVYPLARRLRESRIPFVLLTGYDASALPADLQSAPMLRKPLSADDLFEFLDLHGCRTDAPETDAAGGSSVVVSGTSKASEHVEPPAASIDADGDEETTLRALRHDIRNSLTTIKLVLQSARLSDRAAGGPALDDLDDELRTMQRQLDALFERSAPPPAR